MRSQRRGGYRSPATGTKKGPRKRAFELGSGYRSPAADTKTNKEMIRVVAQSTSTSLPFIHFIHVEKTFLTRIRGMGGMKDT